MFQAEDGIRDLVRSRGLGDVYKRQPLNKQVTEEIIETLLQDPCIEHVVEFKSVAVDIGKYKICLLYTSDAADERSSVDLGGRRIIKKKKTDKISGRGVR